MLWFATNYNRFDMIICDPIFQRDPICQQMDYFS